MNGWAKFRKWRWWWQALAWIGLWPLPLGLWALSVPRERRPGPALLAAASLVVWIAAALTGGADPRGAEQAAPERGSTSTTVGGRAGATTTTASPAPANATTVPTAGTAPPATRPPTTTTINSPPPSTAPPTSSTTTTAPRASTTTTTSTTAPPPPAGGPALLTRLRVAPEGARTGYSRDLFKDWIDADGDRCDTREEVLIAESLTPAQVDPFGCKVLAGDWFSVYDGVTTDQPGDFDVDHVVALAEAWDSGAAAWSPERRSAFANDLDEPLALIAVSASSNRSKSDEDPAQWKPPRREAWCGFATAWTTVKVKWELTADQPEVDALHTMFATCP